MRRPSPAAITTASTRCLPPRPRTPGCTIWCVWAAPASRQPAEPASAKRRLRAAGPSPLRSFHPVAATSSRHDPPGQLAPRARELVASTIQELLYLVEDHGRDPVLRRLGDGALAVPGNDDHLVLACVEADVLPRDIVEDDRVDRFRPELLSRALETRRSLVGSEADEDLSVASAPSELG